MDGKLRKIKFLCGTKKEENMSRRAADEYKLWELFNKRMEKIGYSVSIHDNHNQGRGSYAFKNSDKWIPTISLHVWPDCLSIHVRNRCGSSIINEGATVAIYSLKGSYSAVRFNKMLSYAIEKWSLYGKTNPYIFTEGDDKSERLEF